MQLRHAGHVPGLRHTGTMTALRVCGEERLLAPEDLAELASAWTLRARLRPGAVLWRGRAVDALPSDLRDLDGVARIVGYPGGSAARIGEHYHRSTRRARAVGGRR